MKDAKKIKKSIILCLLGLLIILLIVFCLFPRKTEVVTFADIFGELILPECKGIKTAEDRKEFEERKKRVLKKIDKLIETYEEGERPKTTLTLTELKNTRETVLKQKTPSLMIGGGWRDNPREAKEQTRKLMEELIEELGRRNMGLMDFANMSHEERNEIAEKARKNLLKKKEAEK